MSPERLLKGCKPFFIKTLRQQKKKERKKEKERHFGPTFTPEPPDNHTKIGFVPFPQIFFGKAAAILS